MKKEETNEKTFEWRKNSSLVMNRKCSISFFVSQAFLSLQDGEAKGRRNRKTAQAEFMTSETENLFILSHVTLGWYF
jgi:hypothetical protein